MQADLLDELGSSATIDDALVLLATWISLAGAELSEDDKAILLHLGGILYREGLDKHLSPDVASPAN